jgi:hypothetical protein
MLPQSEQSPSPGNPCAQRTLTAPLRCYVKISSHMGGDTVSTEAVASRRHAGGQPPVIGWKLELPITTWHLLLN